MMRLCARWLLVVAVCTLPLCAAGLTAGNQASPEAPSFLLDISKEFVDAALAQPPIERTEPVNDVILKTQISGVGHTVGQVSTQIVPSTDGAVMDLVTIGTTFTKTVGVKGPVQIYTESTIPFELRQRVTYKADGVTSSCPLARANGETCLLGVSTDLCLFDGLVKKIAVKQYEKNKDEAQAIANEHAEQRLIEGMQTEAGPRLQSADANLKKQVADLQAKGLSDVRFSSSSDTVMVRAVVAGKPHPSEPPPSLAGRPYMALRIQEVMVAEIAKTELAGKTYTGEDIEKKTKKLGGKDSSKKPVDKEWSITFVKDKPLEVALVDGVLKAVLRLAEFTSEDDEYTGMDLTVKYKFRKVGDELKAVREGPIEAFPPNFKPGQKLGARQQAMRSVLQKRFAKVFKEEMEVPDVILAGDLAKAGPLAADTAEVTRGWLLMTWRKK